jgi:hypothetical protein
MERNQNELAFINWFTRQKMVKWADVCAQAGELPAEQFKLDSKNIYVQHAFKKGWLTKREPRRLTAAGWKVSTSFLKK